MTTHTVKAIADDLQLSGSTVRTWATQYNIPKSRKGSKLVFDSNAKLVFEKIKLMKDDDCGFQTITKCLTDVCEEEGSIRQLSDNTTFGLPEIEAVIEKTLIRHQEISEKLSRATYTIGQQEEKIKYLEKDNCQLVESQKLLPSPENFKLLEEKTKQLESENQALKVERELLKRQLNQTFWQKLFSLFSSKR